MTTAVSPDRRRRRAGVRIAASAAVAAAAGGAGVVGFALGWDQRSVGVLVGVACLGAAVALTTWVRHHQPAEAAQEERHDSPPLPCVGCASGPSRRRLLLGLGAALGAGGLGYLVMTRDDAVRRLRTTAWEPGARLVTSDGRVLGVDDLAVGSLVAAWPEGRTDASDSQVVLLRLDPQRIAVDPRRPGWSPQGYVAYSRLCTHMGCPVGLYQQDPQVLVCPCHQAAFDVFDQARPVHGPAARPLPQLPLLVDDEGVLRAQADFSEPVGPSFWDGRR